MYESFFGLRERPFDLTPNPRFLYLTGHHREALSNLQYGITGRKGITVLTGEAGTGKTTVIRAAVDELSGRAVRCVAVSNPVLTREEFYEMLASLFGLGGRAAESKAHFLAELESGIVTYSRLGVITALIIDEAQSLPTELMEEVRLLANLETDAEKLLPVVLCGQPELAERLEQEGLRQLKQRVALRCELTPLDIRETAAYIAGRIAIAGGDARHIFTREAVHAIFDASRGIPRTVSVICDNALLSGFALGQKPVGAGIVLEVCRDFRLGQASLREVPGRRSVAVSKSADGPAAAEPSRALPHGSSSRDVVKGSGAGGALASERQRQDSLFSHFIKKKRYLFF